MHTQRRMRRSIRGGPFQGACEAESRPTHGGHKRAELLVKPTLRDETATRPSTAVPTMMPW